MKIEKEMTQKGFGLLEVLVAMIIISIGLLGVLGLNASLKLTIDALYRQQAVTIAQDLASRMRFNFVNARLGASSQYNDPSGTNGSANPGCIYPNASGSTVCTNAQMAQFDLYQIYQEVANGFTTPAVGPLPGGKITVSLYSSSSYSHGVGCTTVTTGTAIFNIKVSWNAPNGTAENILVQVQP